jgi:DNA polymerase III delta prime subunit
MSETNKLIEAIPFTEKYRPDNFDDIVMESLNKKFFITMLEQKYFPNLLLYGPPGTGKTTTIINLINEYQKSINNINKCLVIHLNASDERGIDIIRNQINQFVKTNNLFDIGFKFVVLDEVDYMTKNAQQALKYLIQSCGKNVKFFLICNYISKIDLSLQHEFICIRFNKLPIQNINSLLKNICEKENIKITNRSIDIIQTLYKSDIRSMINFIQLNQNLILEKDNIISNEVWDTLIYLFSSEKLEKDKHIEVKKFMNMISINYNIDKKQIINDFYNFLILKHREIIIPDIINNMENMIHNYDCDIDILVDYFILDNIESFS